MFLGLCQDAKPLVGHNMDKKLSSLKRLSRYDNSEHISEFLAYIRICPDILLIWWSTFRSLELTGSCSKNLLPTSISLKYCDKKESYSGTPAASVSGEYIISGSKEWTLPIS